jgi:hypothetical protein
MCPSLDEFGQGHVSREATSWEFGAQSTTWAFPVRLPGGTSERYGPTANEGSLRRHWNAALSGKLLRMLTAMHAFRWSHQEAIGHLLIARDISCE